jgi:splicing factor 3A subunit 1
LSALSAREGRNFQFEFLRPTHTLFSYFNHLVEQYTKVLHPTNEALALVSERTTPKGKREFLSKIQKYSTTEKMKRERKKKREDAKELENKAFAEVDWHDYAIVQTIEFTPADADADLPVPMSKTEVESMTLAQKRMAAMIMEDAEEDIAAHNARQAAAEFEASKAVTSANGINGRRDVMEEDDEFRVMRLKEEEERERELARARAVQASSMDASGPMKIKTDYTPKREHSVVNPSTRI